MAGFSAGEFDASFDLAKGHAGEMEGSSVNAVEPGEHSTMGPWLAQRRNHVGVQYKRHRATESARIAGGPGPAAELKIVYARLE